MAKQEQWHEVELVAMLAWFAHCVQSKVEFDETVLRKMTDALEETCERESILTFNDVEKKLRDLSRSSSFRSPIEIAREGTGFFTHLSPQIQEDISNAAKMHATLKKEDKKGSKTDCDAQLDRSLVNISRTRSSGPYTERHQGNWTEKAPRSCWECARRKLHCELISEDASICSRCQARETICRTQEFPESRDIQIRKGPDQDAMHTKAIVEENIIEPGSTIDKVGTEETNPEPQPNPPISQMEKESSDTIKDLKDILRQNDLQLQNSRSKWELEAQKLKDQITTLKKVNRGLEAKNNHLINARNMRNSAGKDPLEELLYAKDEEIWNLRHTNHQIQRLASFAQRIYPSKRHLETRVIDKEIGAIVSELEQLMDHHDPDQAMLMPRLIEGSDFELLTRSVFDQQKAELNSQCKLQLKDCISSYGPGVIVKAYSLAALRDWVFEVDLLKLSPRDTRLLDAYRNAIFLHDGWTRLRNLELAVYNDILSKDYFKDIFIPRRASELTVRLSRALASLFSRSSLHGKDGFHTWDQDAGVWEDRQFHIREMFEAALRLKLATIGNDEVYDLVLSPPATQEEAKKVDTAEQGFARDDTGPQFWLMGTLYSYTSEASSARGCLTDALVQLNNFVKSNDEVRSNSLYHKKILVSRQEHDVRGDRDSIALITNRSSDFEAYDSSAEYRPQRSVSKPSSPILEPSICETCGRGFKLLTSLRRHVKNDECARCLECRIIFKHSSELREHQKTEHQQREEQNHRSGPSFSPSPHETDTHVCKHCGGAFQNHSTLSKHLNNRVCENYRFKCVTCSRLFKDSASLQKHDNEHINLIPNTPEEKLLSSDHNQDGLESPDKTPTKHANELQIHPTVMRLDSAGSCEKCGAQCFDAQILEKHQKDYPQCERGGNFAPKKPRKRHASHDDETTTGQSKRQKKFEASRKKADAKLQLLDSSSNCKAGKGKDLHETTVIRQSTSSHRFKAREVPSDNHSVPTEDNESSLNAPLVGSDANSEEEQPRSQSGEKALDIWEDFKNGMMKRALRLVPEINPRVRDRTQNSATKRGYKYQCGVCLREFDNEHDCSTHLSTHSLCLRTGSAHKVRNEDRAAGLAKVQCMICNTTLTRRGMKEKGLEAAKPSQDKARDCEEDVNDSREQKVDSRPRPASRTD